MEPPSEGSAASGHLLEEDIPQESNTGEAEGEGETTPEVDREITSE